MNEPLWWITKDGDRTCFALFKKHYSYSRRKSRNTALFGGAGERVILRTRGGDALFVWRELRKSKSHYFAYEGIFCTVFRNESEHQSSELIRQADAVADFCWPGQRHYTFVDPRRVRSKNPGFCFLMAGWRRSGMTRSGLLILEKSNGGKA